MSHSNCNIQPASGNTALYFNTFIHYFIFYGCFSILWANLSVQAWQAVLAVAVESSQRLILLRDRQTAHGTHKLCTHPAHIHRQVDAWFRRKEWAQEYMEFNCDSGGQHVL